MPSRENNIERSFAQRMKRRGILAPKMEPPGQSGWPDRIVFLPGGRTLFIELKRKGEVPRPLQEHVHEQLRQRGFVVMVFDDAAEATKYVEKCL